jgi:hypothetical protein
MRCSTSSRVPIFFRNSGPLRDAPGALQLGGELLYAIEFAPHLFLVQRQQGALGKDIGDNLQALDRRVFEIDHPSLDDLLRAGFELDLQLLDLRRGIGVGDQRLEVAQEGHLLDRRHREEHDHPEPEQRGRAATLNRHSQRIRRQGLDRPQRLQIDALPDQHGAGAEA